MFLALAFLLDVVGFIGFYLGATGSHAVSLQLGLELLGSLVSLSLLSFMIHVVAGRPFPQHR